MVPVVRLFFSSPPAISSSLLFDAQKDILHFSIKDSIESAILQSTVGFTCARNLPWCIGAQQWKKKKNKHKKYKEKFKNFK